MSSNQIHIIQAVLYAVSSQLESIVDNLSWVINNSKYKYKPIDEQTEFTRRVIECLLMDEAVADLAQQLVDDNSES